MAFALRSARSSGDSPGAGAYRSFSELVKIDKSTRTGKQTSSMTFWFLLCTEQSLSHRLTTPPSLSANTCTSTCLGLSIYFSTRTVEFPKPLSDSRWADSSASVKAASVGVVTTRIPLPPPPWIALIKTGKPGTKRKSWFEITGDHLVCEVPICFDCSYKKEGSWFSPWYPGTQGTPAATAQIIVKYTEVMIYGRLTWHDVFRFTDGAVCQKGMTNR